MTFEEGSELRYIGREAFSGCTNLSSIVLPPQVEMIGEYCFQQIGISLLSVPANIKEIQKGAYKGCSNLKTVVFSNESVLEKIGEKAFGGCKL